MTKRIVILLISAIAAVVLAGSSAGIYPGICDFFPWCPAVRDPGLCPAEQPQFVRPGDKAGA